MGESSNRESSVKIGDVVEGRYKILKQLGEGGMGTVFLAEHWLIKRRVAMKVLHREFAGDADMIRRFMNEALAAGTLGHPNIVESTDMGFTRGEIPYIVYEYIEGTLLSDEIYRVVELPVRRILRIAFQIASGLEAAHAAGIVHRDLKSDNIFLTDRPDALDHVKVLDFGISRFLEEVDNTAAGQMTMGTPEFMAPEQVTDPDGIDHRVDIYALGVVLYEMLAGRLPFYLSPGPARASRTPNLAAAHELLHTIINDPPPPLVRTDAPPGLAVMVTDKLLAKDPARRYQSMKDVQGAIEAFASIMPRTRSSVLRPIGSLPDDDTPTLAPPSIDSLSDPQVSRARLDPAMLGREIKTLGKRWSLANGELRLQVSSRSLSKLAAVVAQASALGDELQEQPAISLDAPHLVVMLRAADGQFTVMDLVFAARLEQWMRETGWRG